MSEDEKTAIAIGAGLGEVEKIMRERGYTDADVIEEFMCRALLMIWADEDREGLRLKVAEAASRSVDALFDSVGDPRGEDELAA